MVKRVEGHYARRSDVSNASCAVLARVGAKVASCFGSAILVYPRHQCCILSFSFCIAILIELACTPTVLLLSHDNHMLH